MIHGILTIIMTNTFSPYYVPDSVVNDLHLFVCLVVSLFNIHNTPLN